MKLFIVSLAAVLASAQWGNRFSSLGRSSFGNSFGRTSFGTTYATPAATTSNWWETASTPTTTTANWWETARTASTPTASTPTTTANWWETAKTASTPTASTPTTTANWWETASTPTTTSYTQQSVISTAPPTVAPVAAQQWVDPNIKTDEMTFGDTPVEVFEQTKVRKYNIVISQKNIRKLNADISAEKYVPCTLTTDYGGTNTRTYTGVGCRYKGAVGSLLGCLDENTGKLNGKCRKLSFKIDANKFRKDRQKIDGMKRLQLHGMAVDRSLVSERLSYNMMRAAGIAAPRATHAEVYVNGEFDGIYMAIQEVSTSFTKEAFADDAKNGKGAVYKDYWFRPEQSNEAWLDKHHQSGKKDHRFVIEAYNALKTAAETECAVIEKYFDTDSIAAVTAMNDLIGQTDDWRLRHNFYWYVREEWDGTKKLVMIPWDYDRLDDNGGGLDFRRKKQSTWWQSTGFNYNSQECLNPQEDGSVQGWQYATGNRGVILRRKKKALPPDAASPIQCDKITRMLANCVYDKVKVKFDQFKRQFTFSKMNVKIDAYSNQIKKIVEEDKSITYSEWSQGISGLKRYLQTAPNYAATKGRTGTTTQRSVSQFGGFGGLSQFGGFGGFGGGFGR